ncbi:hypothetical protein BY458DRAFT_515226 [Sporodiniella umbellata]|nr:hypothetical protein BY458DRAFT_515226 [Sporodiniella umbellata]
MKRNNATSTRFKDKLFPLHRSITDDNDNTYNEKHPSPFTRLVSKLLGLKKVEEQKKPRLRHNKSHSTTSITKGSVILSSLNQLASPDTPHDTNLPKRKTTIAFAEPNLKESTDKRDQDETSSISSSSLVSISSLESSVSSLNSVTEPSFVMIHKKEEPGRSTARDVLMSLATATSTKTSFLADFDMPPIVLQGRRQDTEPVLTEAMAEKVN